MPRRLTIRTLLAVSAVLALSGLAFPTQVQARLAARIAAKAGPAQVPVQKAYQSPIQSPIQKGVCDPPCITYKSHRLLHCKFDRCDTRSAVLYVTDPCTGCTTAVPVCIPCCCLDQPEVCARAGHFGRDVIDYHWCCGFDIKIIVDKCGDITVHSYGL
jgi:hypothetical protein